MFGANIVAFRDTGEEPTMQTPPKKPYLEENQVARGQKSPNPKRSGVAMHRPGQQGPAELASFQVKRPGNKPPYADTKG
jgi:hypothetical protein